MMRQISRKIKYRYLKLVSEYKGTSIDDFSSLKGECRILNYHGVVEGKPDVYNSRHISQLDFERQMTYFSDHRDIDVISFNNYLHGEINADKFNLVLTFDDGYLNNYENAKPILQKLHFPASFCVSNPGCSKFLWTDQLDVIVKEDPHFSIVLKNKTYLFENSKTDLKSVLMNDGADVVIDFQSKVNERFDELLRVGNLGEYCSLMSVQNVRSLAKNPLFQIVPHGMNHLNLLTLTRLEQRREMLNSIEYVKQFNSVNAYCYAFGNLDKSLMKLASEMGCSNHLGVDKNSNGALTRFVVQPHVNFRQFLFFLKRGRYS